MAIDINDAFEVGNSGFSVTGADGNVLYYLTSGSGDPTGSPAPVNTWVFNETTQLIYYKFGLGDNDWRQIRAADITFDPSTSDLTSTDVQGAIAEAANRNFGKDSNYFLTEFNDSTSGTTWKLYSELTLTVTDTSGINQYRINADFLWGHNSASNDIRARIVLDGVVQKEIRIEPKDLGGDQRIQNNLLIYANNLPVGDHSIELEYRPATSSRTSFMYRSDMEAWRTK